MPKKILYVRGSFAPIDFKSYNVQEIGLGKAFCSLGYDFDFVYLTKRDEQEHTYSIGDCTLRVIPTKSIRFFRSRINMSVLKAAELSSYDLIISAEYGQIMTYLLSRQLDNVVMYSGPYYNLFKIPFMSSIYDLLFTKSINKNCKVKFVKSKLAKEYLESKGYSNVYNVGVGLDINVENTTIKDDTLKLIDYMQSNRCVLYVGSLSARKNFGFLISTFKKLHDSEKDIKLVVIGKGSKEYVNRVITTLPKDCLQDIKFVDRIENNQLQFIYPNAKVFLLPSIQEIFGMVLLEAMYYGAPVISSWNGGSSTLINSEKVGTIVPDFNESHWVSAIKKYLHDEQLSKSTIKNARKLIENDFLWFSIANKILKYSEDLRG